MEPPLTWVKHLIHKSSPRLRANSPDKETWCNLTEPLMAESAPREDAEDSGGSDYNKASWPGNKRSGQGLSA
jgi:hypothetical protein